MNPQQEQPNQPQVEPQKNLLAKLASLSQTHMRSSSLVFVIVAAGFLVGLGAASTLYSYVSHTSKLQASVGTVAAPKQFIAPNIEAESAIVFDPNTQTVIYSKNGTSTRVLASITKLMTALVAHSFIAQEPNKTVQIKAEDLATIGDSGLKVGETWKLSDLVSFTLVTSSNDGAMAIAKSLMPYEDFIHSMNAKSKEIGADLVFTNPSGLDNPEESMAGATGSAQGVALLISEILRHAPQLIAQTDLPELTYKSQTGIVHKAVNTNKAIYGIPQLIGGKTGFTDLAGGNLAVIVNASLNKPIIIVVLGSSIEGRFTDTETLASSTLHYFGS